ncbi:MAG TPA: hypothetical protein VL996_06275, partial [Methylocella sp.]|nr:hypothetical protein [Methylocella sp.]
CQQTTRKAGILGLLGQGTKLTSCKISPKGNRDRHSESPSFAMVNHAATGLKTLNESEFQGRGIKRDDRAHQNGMMSPVITR